MAKPLVKATGEAGSKEKEGGAEEEEDEGEATPDGNKRLLADILSVRTDGRSAIVLYWIGLEWLDFAWHGGCLAVPWRSLGGRFGLARLGSALLCRRRRRWRRHVMLELIVRGWRTSRQWARRRGARSTTLGVRASGCGN